MYIIESETFAGRMMKTALYSLIGILCPPALTVMGFIRMRKLPYDDWNRKILKAVLCYGVVISVIYMIGLPFLTYFFVIKPLMMDLKPETGEHAPHVQWLMREASDVSYYKSNAVRAYEFHIREEQFRKFLSKQNLKEITAPVSVPRYTRYLRKEEIPEEQKADFLERTQKTISHGLYGKASIRGREIEVVFDRDTETAYYHDRMF